MASFEFISKNKKSIRQGLNFLPDLFNHYSAAILREPEVLLGFIIGGFNLNVIKYEDDSMLTSDVERKLQKLLKSKKRRIRERRIKKQLKEGEMHDHQ